MFLNVPETRTLRTNQSASQFFLLSLFYFQLLNVVIVIRVAVSFVGVFFCNCSPYVKKLKRIPNSEFLLVDSRFLILGIRIRTTKCFRIPGFSVHITIFLPSLSVFLLLLLLSSSSFQTLLLSLLHVDGVSMIVTEGVIVPFSF